MSNPVQVFVGTYVGGGGAAQSGVVTFSFANTGGFEVYLPIKMTMAATNTLSAGAEVTLYRTADGGTTWETVGNLAWVFPRPTAASQVQIQDVFIPTGQFLVGVQVGGGQTTTWTAQTLTAWQITAYA